MATRAAWRFLSLAAAGAAVGVFGGPARADGDQCSGTWSQVEDGGAGVRYDGAMVYDSLRDQYILFGGYDGDEITGTTQVFNPTTRKWTDVNTPLNPPGRLYHNMVYDKARDRVVLFGGFNGDILGDTWEYEPGEKIWKQRFVPGAPYRRFLAAMTYDSVRNVTVMHGGTLGVGGDRQNNETWEWDGIAWSLRTTLGPEARNSHAMAFDSRRGVTVMHGGSSGANDTWEWDGQAWSKRPRAGTAPEAARYHVMTYDSARGVTVLTAQEADPADPLKTYEWDGVQWKLAAMDGPASRYLVQMVYDQARARSVIFGGYSSGGIYFDDMWEWAGSAGAAVAQLIRQPESITVCDGGVASFEVEVSGGESVQYQWRRNGIPIPGQTTNRIDIAPVDPTDVGRFDCLITSGCGSVSSIDVTLSICEVDLNCDGIVDFGDYLQFLSYFDGSDARADFTKDGTVDFADYLDFLNAFDEGC